LIDSDSNVTATMQVVCCWLLYLPMSDDLDFNKAGMSSALIEAFNCACTSISVDFEGQISVLKVIILAYFHLGCRHLGWLTALLYLFWCDFLEYLNIVWEWTLVAREWRDCIQDVCSKWQHYVAERVTEQSFCQMMKWSSCMALNGIGNILRLWLIQWITSAVSPAVAALLVNSYVTVHVTRFAFNRTCVLVVYVPL